MQITTQGSNGRHKITIESLTQTELEQVQVMLRALEIFIDRSKKYHGSWRAYGAMGAAFFLKDRANRVWVAIRDTGSMTVEDCVDLINIASFCVRSHEEGNIGGEFWPNAKAQ